MGGIEDGVDPGGPTYHTYYMVDWTTVHQSVSRARCVSCGGEMMNVEPIRTKAGVTYEGMVCHHCKTIYWLRAHE